MEVGILMQIKCDAYETIAHAVKQGFHNGQLAVWDMSLYNEHTVKEIKRACADFDFTPTAVWCGWSGPVDWSYPNMYLTLGLIPSDWRAKRVEDILQGAKFARELGVTDIITHVGYLPDNPFHPDRLAVVQALRYICKELKAHGQYFLFETGEELPLSLVHLMNDVGMDNMGVNFDPANLIMNGRGSCPVTTLEFLLPYVRGFHAKDAKKLVAPTCTKQEVPVGKGDVKFPELIAMLRNNGYQGYITIEHEKYVSATREQEIQETKDYLNKLIHAI